MSVASFRFVSEWAVWSSFGVGWGGCAREEEREIVVDELKAAEQMDRRVLFSRRTSHVDLILGKVKIMCDEFIPSLDFTSTFGLLWAGKFSCLRSPTRNLSIA